MAIADIWVVPVVGIGWGLKLELASHTFLVRESKSDAIAVARGLARESRCVLVILGEDGGLESRESHRGLPAVPK